MGKLKDYIDDGAHERGRLYDELVSIKGLDHQLDIYTCEIYEFMTALTKMIIGRIGIDKFYDELADFIICSEQFLVYSASTDTSYNDGTKALFGTLEFDNILADDYKPLRFAQQRPKTETGRLALIDTTSLISEILKLINDLRNGNVDIVMFTTLASQVANTVAGLLQSRGSQSEQTLVVTLQYKIERLRVRVAENINL